MSKKQILKHVGRIVPDPEVKRFFSRLDYYHSKISCRRKLKYNLAVWKRFPSIPYSVPDSIEYSSVTFGIFSYV